MQLNLLWTSMSLRTENELCVLFLSNKYYMMLYVGSVEYELGREQGGTKNKHSVLLCALLSSKRTCVLNKAL